jgi:hypothetical protein
MSGKENNVGSEKRKQGIVKEKKARYTEKTSLTKPPEEPETR